MELGPGWAGHVKSRFIARRGALDFLWHPCELGFYYAKRGTGRNSDKRRVSRFGVYHVHECILARANVPCRLASPSASTSLECLHLDS
jgi:hypothetical protein